jgi:hypothetical protein
MEIEGAIRCGSIDVHLPRELKTLKTYEAEINA